MINAFGGKMDDAVGIPEEQLRRAASSAVCKINIDSDGRLAMTALSAKYLPKTRLSSTPGNIWGPHGTSLLRW